MNLFELPEDVLRDITQHLHWLDIANLWFTGSSPILRKLSNAGIAQLDLQFSSNLRPFRWPSLFARLPRLAFLRIHDYYSSDDVVITSDHLTFAAHTLKEMRLNCTGAFDALHTLLQADTCAFPVLHTLEIHITSRDAPLADQLVLTWPKSLTSLTFQSARLPRPPLRLASLPPHLTDFYGGFEEILDAHTDHFPQTLTSLRLNLAVFTDILPLLPSGLLKLMYTLGGIPSMRRRHELDAYKLWRRDGIRNLPPSLLTLQLPITQYSRSTLTQLPQSLTEIQHWDASVPVEDLPFLPPMLKDGSNLLPVLIPKDVAPHIPKSIEHVLGAVDVDAIPYLPKNVRTLGSTSGPNASLVNELKLLNLDKIPSALESLIIYQAEGFPFAALPTTLTILKITGGSFHTSLIGLLPPLLKVLEITSGSLSESVEDWKRLPKFLETLSVNSSPALSVESSTFLPRTLTRLKILNCRYVPLDWFAGLPENLSDLQLPLTHPPDSQNLSTWNMVFPPRLTRLQLYWTALRAETARRVISSLPSSLTSLRILRSTSSDSDYTSFVDEDLLLLPRRLKEIELRSCDALTVGAAQHLPRTCISVLLDSKSFVYRKGKRTLGGR